MRNPFRSEADAFRLVLLTIGYFVLIVIGSVINVWLGVAVFVVLTAAALWWLLARRGREAPPARQAPAPSPPEQHRVLVLANEAVDAERLLAAVQGRIARREASALVVCPALTSPLQEWASDVDPARGDAQARLDASLAALRGAGIDARGEIGDGDPIQAIEDAVRTFRPDELVVATPAGDGVVEKARERFAVPVTHVTADPR
jgi:GABA permease